MLYSGISKQQEKLTVEVIFERRCYDAALYGQYLTSHSIALPSAIQQGEIIKEKAIFDTTNWRYFVGLLKEGMK